MDVMAIVWATVVVGAVGLIIGILLGIAGHIFAVEIDEKEAQIRAALPGNNCGGCGFPGCDGCAHAIFTGEARVDQCPVGGAAVAAKIAEIMGAEVEIKEANKAVVHCKGDCDLAVLNDAGRKVCTFGCIGCGLCEKNCNFDAVHVVNGCAVVDVEKCKGCGVCASKCPRKIIEMVPESKTHAVLCSNQNKGKEVKDVCKAGCLGCTLCAKNCPAEAITMENNLPKFDYEKCTNCGTCAEKCPAKAIR